MKKRLLNFAGIFALFLIASIGAQVSVETARAALWQWSKTATNNATADPSINWSEGMSPSSVNDSARAMMSRLAEARDDNSGVLLTTGGPTAFTVTSNQGFPNPPNAGMGITVAMNVTNAANATLSVDGGPAWPIIIPGSSAVPAGVLVQYFPYRFLVQSNQWLVVNYFGTLYDAVPLGGLVPYTGTVAPNPNFILPAGQCISTTTYAAYWVLLGSPAPGACGAGTFAVIDLRGRMLVALDNLNGTAAGRLTSAATGCGTAMTFVGASCTNGSQSHTQLAAEMAAHFHQAGISDPQHAHSAGISDPTHYHQAAIYDPTHAHGGILTPSNLATVGGVGSAALQYGNAGNTAGAATGVLVNGNVGGGYTYTAATGVLVNGGPNGNNATYSAGTGVLVNGGANGNGNTYTTGNSQAAPIVNPNIGVTYLLRVL